MATPITVLDSPNVAATISTTSSIVTQSIYNVASGSTLIVTYSGGASGLGQADIDYLLSAKNTLIGTLITGSTISRVGFSAGWLLPPVGSANYDQTSVTDFQFFVNGQLVDRTQIVGFDDNSAFLNEISGTQTTLSVQLGYDLRPYDVVTAVGKFNIP